MLFIGNNTMVLNAATVCGILEKHLNDSLSYGLRSTQEMKVSNVEPNQSEGTYSFSVTIEEKTDAKKAA